MEELLEVFRQIAEFVYEYPELLQSLLIGSLAFSILHYSTKAFVMLNVEQFTWKSTGKADQRHSDEEGLYDIYEQVCFTAWYGGKHKRWVRFAHAVRAEDAGELVAEIEAKQDNGTSVYKTKKN